MIESTPGFSGFKISNYYKYILYLAGVILVLSLFLPVQGLDNSYIRHIAFWIVMAGLLNWFISGIVEKINDYIYKYDSYHYRKNYRELIIIFYMIQVAIWSIVFFVFFK